MSKKDVGNLSAKHGENKELSEKIVTRDFGTLCHKLRIRFSHCQLGTF
jgi:hypothetical protein